MAVVYGSVSSDTSSERKEYEVTLYPPEVVDFTTVDSLNKATVEEKFGEVVLADLTLDSERSQYSNLASGDLWYENLDELENDEIYEFWLVDVETGYSLSLGVFSMTTSSGNGRFSFSYNGYIDEYDKAVVTVEPYPDTDPSPSGDVTLVADINLEHLLHRSEPVISIYENSYQG